MDAYRNAYWNLFSLFQKGDLGFEPEHKETQVEKTNKGGKLYLKKYIYRGFYCKPKFSS